MPSAAIAPKIAGIAESATLAITAKAAALRADGKDVIGFGAGEPDFPTPAHVVAAAAQACADPAMHRYSPVAGLAALREAIAERRAQDTGLDVSPGDVLVTNGGKHAVFNTIATLVGPGDEVLLPAPYWVTYPEAIRVVGGVPVEIPTSGANGFQVTVADLEAARTERTKLLIFVSPSNPTGAVYPPEAVAEIGRWAAQHGIWVMTDEIYQYLVYGDAEFASMPVVAPEVADRCVVVDGVAKTYAMTGWRVGWMMGPSEVIAAAKRFQSHVTSNVCNVAQAAALAAISGPQDEVAAMRAVFDRRRHTIVNGLNSIPGVACNTPQGAFYAFPSFDGLLGRTFAGQRCDTTMDLASVILDAANVAIVPGEAFGAPGYARLSYALGDEDLAKGLDRLVALLSAPEA
ncbi:MAG: pyridoxal phosphate-dependent aminotransferase [Actinobacteria bacterium]|nr:pyridoxal phosphate-dependent aminotransferase [Actinomycetota bacterium]MCB9388653.1 pyridoxal phosphate-dependent aminotransferase [Acidimicrobiia bacterium]